MKIRLAGKADDAQLRVLTRETVVPGHIRMIYAREPSYFDGVRASGGTTQVIVVDDGGRIVGEGCRSLRDLYVNGQPTRVGYLSGLRLRDGARNGTLLARGYAYLKQLHGDHATPAYLTTIIHGNEHARKLLTSNRAGLPSYIPMGTYVTCVIPVRSKPGRQVPSNGCRITSAVQVPEDALRDFLSREGPRRQFFPVCATSGGGSGILDAIGLEHVLVALRGDRISGVLALWNQEQHRQVVVDGYSRLFAMLRPCLNAVLRVKGCAPLPPPGERLRYATAALVCVGEDGSDIFTSLLRAALARAAEDGLHQLALGLHERDPLRLCMKRYFYITYRSSLYLVTWDGRGFYASLDGRRIPYLELGTL